MKRILCVVALAFGLTFFAGNSVQAQKVKEEYKTKKPWSHRKKDAVIGAGAGAITGALIGHGAKGAVIGGVAGGAGGYLLGKHKDKKDPVPQKRTVYTYKRKRS
ncbi:MAG: YMGG-like glycine zipper-containing protein [Flavisolibacter sp.]